jgi:hypothetical protein
VTSCNAMPALDSGSRGIDRDPRAPFARETLLLQLLQLLQPRNSSLPSPLNPSPRASAPVWSRTVRVVDVARGLRCSPGMTHSSSHPAGTVRAPAGTVRRLSRPAEMSATPVGFPAIRRLRNTTVAPRTGLLRLAPPLSVLPGNRKRPNWPAIARGMRAAVTRVSHPGMGDTEDGPQCA